MARRTGNREKDRKDRRWKGGRTEGWKVRRIEGRKIGSTEEQNAEGENGAKKGLKAF